MKTIDLTERRRNPLDNTKQSSMMNIMNQPNPEKKFISFTELPKLGINPHNVYGTPTAIYAYPLEFIIDAVPYQKIFASTRPYYWIFEIDHTARVANIQPNGALSDEDIQFIKSNQKIPAQLKKRLEESEYTGRALLAIANMVAKSKSANKTKDADALTTTRIVTANMNAALRHFGYSAIIDHGSGSIHPNEPEQIMILDPTIITNKKLYSNNVRNNSPEFVLACTRSSGVHIGKHLYPGGSKFEFNRTYDFTARYTPNNDSVIIEFIYQSYSKKYGIVSVIDCTESSNFTVLDERKGLKVPNVLNYKIAILDFETNERKIEENLRYDNNQGLCLIEIMKSIVLKNGDSYDMISLR